MQLCRSLCDFFDKYVTSEIPSLNGLVCVGSVSYIDATDTDLDLLVVDSDGGNADTLETLHSVLLRPSVQEKIREHYGVQATALSFVRARVPILKMNLYDSHTQQVWPVDMSVLIAVRQSKAFVLYDVVQILPHVINKGRQFLSLCFTEFVKHEMRDNTLFSKSLIVLVRQWAQNRQLYGTVYGFPGGSAWIVMLWLFCETVLHNSSSPSVIIDDRHLFRLMCMFYAKWPWPLPLTRVNCFAVFKNDQDAYDWQFLPLGVTKHCCGEVVLPLPDEVQKEQKEQINMTHTVGVIQHSTILWEMQRAMAYDIDVVQPIVTDTELCTSASFYIVFVCDHRNDMQWQTHVQSFGITRMIDRLYHLGVLSRPFCVTPNMHDMVHVQLNGSITCCLPVNLICWVTTKDAIDDNTKNVNEVIQDVCTAIQLAYTDEIESDIVVQVSHLPPFVVQD